MENEVCLSLSTWRHERGMTQSELARETGLSLMTISRYENEGIGNATIKNTAKIAKALDIKPYQIRF